ncbi:hypothetical protein [Candidatus Enterococcus leclercqii]|uniref:hypothetical protein n=1 Tax=Candidatus Enterococcus leclercqii TaxID=1857218 RepID=UPI00137B87C3|nr:hypothetical protein [Enterococcus sp. CU9D]
MTKKCYTGKSDTCTKAGRFAASFLIGGSIHTAGVGYIVVYHRGGQQLTVRRKNHTL